MKSSTCFNRPLESDSIVPRRRQFRFDTLLRVRKREEEQKAQSLATARRDVRNAEHERRQIVETQARMLHQAGSTATNRFDASEVHRYFIYERHLARVAAEKDAQIIQLRKVEEERRAELEEAMKKKRIVERLKERHRDALHHSFHKEDQALLDEVATNRTSITQRKRPSP